MENASDAARPVPGGASSIEKEQTSARPETNPQDGGRIDLLTVNCGCAPYPLSTR